MTSMTRRNVAIHWCCHMEDARTMKELPLGRPSAPRKFLPAKVVKASWETHPKLTKEGLLQSKALVRRQMFLASDKLMKEASVELHFTAQKLILVPKALTRTLERRCLCCALHLILGPRTQDRRERLNHVASLHPCASLRWMIPQ